MNNRKIKKSITKLSLGITNKVKEFSEKVNELEIGYLYTCFHEYENKVLIGFIKSIDADSKYYRESGYRVVEKRSGSKKESDLLKKTLIELGHEDQNSSGVYSYSKELINHLNILGWPIGEFKKYTKRY
tara:strand:- start:127 stop:513 length:387 start_codon:yes stop_codon:yes gene_type:complete